jgi:hypothetical protein
MNIQHHIPQDCLQPSANCLNLWNIAQTIDLAKLATPINLNKTRYTKIMDGQNSSKVSFFDGKDTLKKQTS